MKSKQKILRNVAKTLEFELSMIAAKYHDDPTALSHLCIAEVIGKVFAAQCMHGYGLQGFEYADKGMRAILGVIGNLPENSSTTLEARLESRI